MSIAYTGDAATTRTNLGLGDAATKTVGTGATDIPLNSNLGTASTVDTGTGAGNVPVLDGSGAMPAVDGSALTGIDALPTGGTDGQVLTSDASGTGTWQDAAGGGMTLGTETAGTAMPVTFGSIPAGVSQIIVLFHDCGTNNNEDVRIKLGDAGGIESSGYYSATHTQDASTGQSVYNAGAFDVKVNGSGGEVLRAAVTLYHLGSNKWVMTQMGISDSGVIVSGGGSKTLSAELTQIKVETPYTTFSAGTVNIMYQ